MKFGRQKNLSPKAHGIQLNPSEVTDDLIKKYKNARGVVLLCYCIKPVLKIFVASLVASPILVADAWHSFIDLCEHWILRQMSNKQTANTPYQDIKRKRSANSLRTAMVAIAASVAGGILFTGWKLFFTTGANPTSDDTSWLLMLFSFNMLSISGLGGLLLVVVLVFSSCISLFIYFKETKFATALNLPLLEGEAKDTRRDSIGEFILAVVLAVQLWAYQGWSGSELILSNLNQIHGVTIMFLASYILYELWGEYWSLEKKLMYSPIDDDLRKDLESFISDILPNNCNLIEPIEALESNKDVKVTGLIEIGMSLSSISPTIVKKAKQVSRQFMKKHCSTFQADFSSVLVPSEEDIENDRIRILEEIWKIDKDSPFAFAFALLKKGKMQELDSYLEGKDPETDKELLFKLWLEAECALKRTGSDSEKTKMVLGRVYCVIASDCSLNAKAMFSCWMLFVLSNQAQSSDDDFLLMKISDLREHVNSYLENCKHKLPKIVLAECAFAIGHSYEKNPKYKIADAMDYYSKAEELYSHSGVYLESDRLTTAWGHLQTLLYNLMEGTIHLEESRDIKLKKNDQVGLAHVFGCLADAYSKCGRFSEAKVHYNQDIKLIKQSGTTADLLPVKIRKAESTIRDGIYNGKKQVLLEAKSQLDSIQEELGDEASYIQFFYKKAIIKTNLGLASLAKDSAERKSYLSVARELLEETDPVKPNQKAFCERLYGRLAGHENDTQNVVVHFDNAEQLFAPMSKDELNTGSLQSILSRVESALWLDRHKNAQVASDETLGIAISELQQFLDVLSCHLDDAEIHINILLDEYNTAVQNSDIKSAHTSIERLIGFLEG